MLGRLALAVVLGLSLTPFAFAQEAAAPIPAPLKSEAKPKVQRELLVFLARDALAALNHANRSGNYAVLRALGTESFQKDASEETLAATFADFRARSIDLGSVLVLDPVLAPDVSVEGGTTIHLAGVFPTKPLAVVFDLRMTRTASGWRIAELSVAARDANPRAAAAETPGRQAAAPRKLAAKPMAQKKAASPQQASSVATGAVPLATTDY